ncbi:MAG: polysaccharide deacetylase family protein [Polyangiaceae bacterium]
MCELGAACDPYTRSTTVQMRDPSPVAVQDVDSKSRIGASIDIALLPSIFAPERDVVVYPKRVEKWPSHELGSTLPASIRSRIAMAGSLFSLRTLVPLSALAIGSWIGLVGRETAERDVGHALDRAHTAIYGDLTIEKVVRRFEQLTSPDRAEPSDAPQEANVDPKAPPSIDPSTLPDPAPFPRMNPTANVGRAWLLAEGPAYEPNDNKRFVTLTFDDGPIPETTPGILRTLAQYKVHATFFLIGRYLDGTDSRAVATRRVAASVLAAGHSIGNHTHDHLLLTTANHAAALAQIEEGAASIERAIGRSPVFFRPPYGQLDPYTEDILQKRSDEVVMWNVEAADMLNDDPDAMAASLEQQIVRSNGGVVLLHDVKPSTARTLPKLLLWLHQHAYDPARPTRVGYQIVDLPEYLRQTAAHPQPYSDRAEVEQGRRDVLNRAHARHVTRSES